MAAEGHTVQVSVGEVLEREISRHEAKQDELVDQLLAGRRRNRRRLYDELVASCLTAAALRYELRRRGDVTAHVDVSTLGLDHSV